MKYDLTTYEMLVTPHLARLRAYARRRVASAADADDLLQSALLHGFQHFHELRAPEAMRAWLYRIVGSLARELDRTRRRRAELLPITALEERHSEWIASDAPTPLELLVRQRSVEVLRRALAKLPEDFAVAVELCDLEGFSYREIADIERIPLGTVMSRIARGRRLLAHLLADDGERMLQQRRERRGSHR